MKQLIYILSASHSGSTLLALLLGTHPRMVTAGELKATHLGDLTRYRCSCGEPIRQCPFWRQVCEGMARQGVEFDLARADTDFRQVGSPFADYLLKPLVRGPFWETLRDTALQFSPAWRTRLPVLCRRNVALVNAICELADTEIVVDSSKIGIRLKYLLRIP